MARGFHVMVVADFLMKRLAMNFESALVDGLPIPHFVGEPQEYATFWHELC